MAYIRNITSDDQVFYDTDNFLDFTVYQGNPTAEQIEAGDVIPEDISAYELTWVLKKKAKDTLELITKTIGDGIEILGDYDPDPAINTQIARVTLKDTDTYDPDVSPEVNIKPGTYVHALKRTDEDNETVYTVGTFTLLQAAAWE